MPKSMEHRESPACGFRSGQGEKGGHPRGVAPGKPRCCEARKTAVLQRKLLKTHRSRMDLSKKQGQRQKIIFKSHLVIRIIDDRIIDDRIIVPGRDREITAQALRISGTREREEAT